jgi:hypothetical protein
MPASSLKYLDGSQVRVMLVAGAIHPHVEIIDDRCVIAAQFKRIFPLSHSEKYISIQDPADHEIGILETIDGMPMEQREIIVSELDRRYFTPAIEKIDELKQDAGMWKFNVQTQRGAAEFFVRNWRDSAHEAGAGRWQIQSVDGLRFEILKVEELDARSQNLLEQLF